LPDEGKSIESENNTSSVGYQSSYNGKNAYRSKGNNIEQLDLSAVQISMSDIDREHVLSAVQAINQTTLARASEQSDSTTQVMPKNTIHSHNSIHSTEVNDEIMQNKDMKFIDTEPEKKPWVSSF